MCRFEGYINPRSKGENGEYDNQEGENYPLEANRSEEQLEEAGNPENRGCPLFKNKVCKPVFVAFVILCIGAIVGLIQMNSSTTTGSSEKPSFYGKYELKYLDGSYKEYNRRGDPIQLFMSKFVELKFSPGNAQPWMIEANIGLMCPKWQFALQKKFFVDSQWKDEHVSLGVFCFEPHDNVISCRSTEEEMGWHYSNEVHYNQSTLVHEITDMNQKKGLELIYYRVQELSNPPIGSKKLEREREIQHTHTASSTSRLSC